MKMTRPTFRRLSFALAALSLASSGHAARSTIDESDLPESLRSGYVSPIDGPADNAVYARGTLGLIRPTYGRASLFAAWRVMHLPVGALAKENHRRQGDWVHGSPSRAPAEDEIAAWLKARGALVSQAPAVNPSYFRSGKLKVDGIGTIDVETGQCGPDAYAFATRTLGDLVADSSLKDGDRKAWISRQDAVFARCSWVPGSAPAPALPAPLSAGSPAKLKALYDYQHAAALFYGDDYLAARQAFDAIAAVPDHPMRAWATLGALRSLVRGTVRDAEWDAAVQDAWGKRQLRGAAFNAAVAEAAARRNARVKDVLNALEVRGKKAKADASLAPVHAAINYTVRRALVQLVPAIPLGLVMASMDRPEANPYATGVLDLFQELYPRVSPDRPQGPLAASMREHAWFDFIVTVQACAGGPKAPAAAVCDAEHAHALARWQETKDNAWLLATLMTARQPSAADMPAAEAARAVSSDRPEWASLQLYAARVLRTQGRDADVRAAMDALSASPVVHKRDRALLEAVGRGDPLPVGAPAALPASVSIQPEESSADGGSEYAAMKARYADRLARKRAAQSVP